MGLSFSFTFCIILYVWRSERHQRFVNSIVLTSLIGKTPLTYLSCQRSLLKTKTSLTEIYSLSRTNNTNTIRGATLIHRNDPMHLAGYQHIPGICTLAYSVAEYFGKIHLTAPSAVHLTTCFLPDSQHHRFSVKASLPLSPLQRFEVLNYLLLYSRLPALSIGMYRLLQIFRTLLCEVLNQGFYALLRF